MNLGSATGPRPSRYAIPLQLAAAGLILVACGRDEAARAGAALIPAPDTAAMQPRVAQAIDAARRGVDADRGSDEAWGRLGGVCDVHDLFDCAAAAYRVAIELAPDKMRWPYLLALTIEKQGGDARQVETLFDRARAIAPDFAPLYVRIGDVQMRRGRLAEARAAYSRAIELDPESAAAELALSQALIDLDRPEEALQHLESARRLGGDDRRLHAARARAYRLLGDEPSAAAASEQARQFESVIALTDPVRGSITALGVSSGHCYDRAKELMERGLYPEALAQLRIVEESQPNFASLHHRLGIAYSRTGQIEPAIRHLRQALELNQELSDARGMLGALLLQQGQAQEASIQFRRALEDDADNVALSVGLASAMQRAGNADEAIAELRRMAGRTELDANGEYLLGTLLLRRGEAAEAVRHCSTAVRLKPDHAAAHERLGQALEAIGRVEQAREHFARADGLRPGGPGT